MTEQIERRRITDFPPDPNNANQGTERGSQLLEKSISEVGAGRSLVVSRDGVVLAGNKTQQALVDAGIEDAVVVHTDGRQVVIVQRDDIEAGSREAIRLALLDNRTGEVSLDWDVDVLADIREADEELLAGLWTEKELEFDLGLEGDGPLEDGLVGGVDIVPEQWLILIECQSEEEQLELLKRFGEEGIACQALIS
jgi:hypothetical protein